MDNLQKQEFTRRICNSNRGQMIVVIYDIFFVYAQEAEDFYEKQDFEKFKDCLRKAQAVVLSLRDALDFKYEVSKDLYRLYQFSLEQISACFYKNNTQGLLQAKKVLKGLYDGFLEAEKQDTSEPLMKHTQQVVAGMTYQRGNLTETFQDSGSSRGFFA